MRWRCKHRWQDEAVDWQPLAGRPTHVKNVSEEVIEAVMAGGLTVVTQRCEECNMLRSYTVPGKLTVGRG